MKTSVSLPGLILFLFMVGSVPLSGQPDNVPIVTYAGQQGNEVFHDVCQLSDGSWLIAGAADDLEWLDPSVERWPLQHPEIPNANGTGRVGFLLHLEPDLQDVMRVFYFPPGVVEDIRYMKWTHVPGQSNGALYLSCNTSDSKANGGGYVIVRLDGNVVDQWPSGASWVFPVWAEGYAKNYHPWDVDADGNVWYVRGQSHDYDWGALHVLNAEGKPRVVEHFRTHWIKGGGEWRNTPASSFPGGVDSLDFSGIVLKYLGRCDLRSWNADDYGLMMPDGNGGLRQGLWPMDVLFDGPCHPDAPAASGPGYTGYKPAGTPVYGASSVVVDRRTGEVYLGMNAKSVLPGGQPDFEPAVIAFSADGALRWWSRLYHEITPDGTTVNSSPDQYIDALAIDYTHDQLVVNARCHGNNVENFWEGNMIVANPEASGFQNRFTGSSGNIHISWLGKLELLTGILQHSTYVGEYAEGTGGLGPSHADPNLDGWPDPNAGWPDLNTTRLAVNGLKVTADGSTVVLGTGRRTVTTMNAWQKMVLPQWGGLSCWNSFVRVYTPDLGMPRYSSLVVGVWDTLTQEGGGNTQLFGAWKTTQGIVAVGRQVEEGGLPKGNPLPLTNVPDWGTEVPQGESAILVYFPAENLVDPADGPMGTRISSPDPPFGHLQLVPNPTSGSFRLDPGIQGPYPIEILNPLGGKVYEGLGIGPEVIPGHFLPGPGIYLVRAGHAWGKLIAR